VASFDLPAPVREFIARHVRSVEQLEILLLLARSPKEAWSPRAVYDTILSTPQSVASWLEELTRSGLLEIVPQTDLQYRCTSDPDLRSRIEELAELYRIRPVRVIESIYRPSADPLRSFADAFKFNDKEHKP
jgi:hypothetical protein